MDMDLDNFIHLVTWAKKHGWKNILFLGGEPTVHPQFEEILDICYKKQITVYLSTNGLINGRLLKKFKLSSIRHIAFSYPQDKVSRSIKKQFLDNLEYLTREKIFVMLSGVLNGQNEKWEEIIDTAAAFNLSIRWSLQLPGFTRDTSYPTVFSNLNLIGSQLFQVLKTCAENRVICYVYRPVPACMFSPEQWLQIRKIFRNIVYTRCPLGFKKRYSAGITVNPDLSTYACISFFIKGPRITSFKDRVKLSQYYEGAIKDIMKSYPIKECVSCNSYKNFLSTIGMPKDGLIKDRLDDKNICQAGCFSFRETICAIS
jgi:MoaA/NifB/PqqE/SkfB family radical SAM enzyme